MQPHIQTQIDLLNVALYTLRKRIKPKLNLHNPDINTCWRWTGSMSHAAIEKYTSLSQSGRVTLFRTKKPFPIYPMESGPTLFVHRFLFNIYRSPALPVTNLVRNRPCDDTCCNPFHFDCNETDIAKSKSKPWPQTSFLRGVLNYLAGEVAEDSETLQKRLYLKNDIELEHEKKMRAEFVVLTHEQYQALKSENKTTGEVLDVRPEGKKEIHAFAMQKWLVDRFTNEAYRGPTQDYNAVAHYLAVMQDRVQGLGSLDVGLVELLEWYSVPLPTWTVANDNEYWIGRENLESAEQYIRDALNEGRKTASEIFKMDKQTHVFLLLTNIAKKKIRNIDLDAVDWTK